MLPSSFSYLSLLLIFIGDFGYLFKTIQGKVKPNRVSWFLWGILPIIIFFAQLSKGVKMEALVTLALGLTPILIFLATFLNKKSIWALSVFDWICGVLSVLGIVAWYISKDGNYAIAFTIIAQFFAGIPTYKKSYTNPESESYVIYLLNGVATAIALLTVKDWRFANYIYLLFTFVSCMFTACLIKYRLGVRSTN